MLIRTMRQAGVTIIEMMIALTIMALLVFLALPNMSAWLNNTQIRTASETLLAGINLARSEALRSNSVVRFQMTTTLDSDCVLSTTGTSWVVSLADPTGACEKAPSSTAPSPDPLIIQKKLGSEGAQRVTVTADASTIYFNGLGRPVSPGGAANIAEINIENPAGLCQKVGGTMRCLRINISNSGQVKMCDPVVPDTDPRYCSN